MRIIAAPLLALTVATSALAGDVDWKAYGFVEHADGDLVCFYDAQSVSLVGALTRVWVKCVLQKELQDFGTRNREKIQASAQRKTNEGYVPPFVSVLGGNSKRVNAITAAEEIADMGEVVQTRSRFFYELDCANGMERRLNAYAIIDGKEIHDDSPGDGHICHRRVLVRCWRSYCVQRDS